MSDLPAGAPERAIKWARVHSGALLCAHRWTAVPFPGLVLPQGIHVFLSVNGSMCPTTCKAPEGPVCEAACQYNELAKKHNKEIEMEQVNCHALLAKLRACASTTSWPRSTTRRLRWSR